MKEDEINRLKGMFFGLAVGDALGTTLEFKYRDVHPPITEMEGGGPFNLQPGEWTDDTSLALALAQTLIDHSKGGWATLNKIELLNNFTRWYKYGAFSHNDRCFDIGTTTRQALAKFIASNGTNDNPASNDPFASGNGGIMRLAPVVVWAATHQPPKYVAPSEYAIHLAHQQSKTTHKSPECLYTARIMAKALMWAMYGAPKKKIRSMMTWDMPKSRDEVKSTGYVIDTWTAANWCVQETDNFKDALLLAVNLADDADTVGAVTGQLAGAIYGYDEIPEEWLKVLAWNTRLEEVFNQLCGNTDEKLHDRHRDSGHGEHSSSD